MIDFYLVLSALFLGIFVLGRWLERLHIPWIFTALILGLLLSLINNPFSSTISSPTFNMLSELGMFFLLFMIGYEIDLKKIKRSGKFIIRTTFTIILLETILGGILVHLLFGYSWTLSFIIALSFATVGEVILVPILQQYNMINTSLGQTIISIGVLDDVIEVVMLVIVILYINSQQIESGIIYTMLGSLTLLFLFTYFLTKLKIKTRFIYFDIERIFLLVMAILFLFLGVGEYAESAALGAVLAGISVKSFIPTHYLKKIDESVKTLAYGFFSPIFFIKVGTTVNPSLMFVHPVLLIAIIVVTKSAKIIGSIISGYRELGLKRSIVLGIGLSAKFSTSIVIIKILFDNGVVSDLLYSLLISASVIFNFIIPLLFSYLIKVWKIR